MTNGSDVIDNITGAYSMPTIRDAATVYNGYNSPRRV